MNISDLNLTSTRDLYSSKIGGVDLPEHVLDLVDYCRTNYRNITAPIPVIENKHLNLYYWVCYAFDELARMTGDRIEFQVITDQHKNVDIQVWTRQDAMCRKHLLPIVTALKKKDISGLLDGSLFPNDFYLKADPLREEELRKKNNLVR